MSHQLSTAPFSFGSFSVAGGPQFASVLYNDGKRNHQVLALSALLSAADRLDSDAVFGVKASLIRDYIRHEYGPMPDGTPAAGAWRHLAFKFCLKPLG